jgi:hypothetical protein
MALPTAILNALNAQKPALAAMYGRMVEGTYARMVRDLGPTLPGIYNNWTYARLWGNWISRLVIEDFDAARLPRKVRVGFHLDRETIAKEGMRYAEDTIAEFNAKIERKVSGLKNVTVKNINSAEFVITGTHADGQTVSIVQRHIINVSKLGTPFNQFPARIRIDGKAISEAAYNKL